MRTLQEIDAELDPVLERLGDLQRAYDQGKATCEELEAAQAQATRLIEERLALGAEVDEYVTPEEDLFDLPDDWAQNYQHYLDLWGIGADDPR
ncbi:MAG: hypothetical protein ACJ8AW_11345 [Rhodopila sp.]